MLTQEQLKKLLRYDKDTGVFHWIEFRNGRAVSESVAGSFGGGYVHIKVNKKSYLAHRLAWLYVHGQWPKKSIDHKDMNRSNNCISNLREATEVQNGQNRRSPQSNNSSGLLGVFRLKNRKNWRAQIRVNCKQIYLGVFPTAQEAHEAYVKAKREMHPFGML